MIPLADFPAAIAGCEAGAAYAAAHPNGGEDERPAYAAGNGAG
jgi:hypothetical protein